MLRAWMNILPLFIIKILARKYGEHFAFGGIAVAQATPGVFVQVSKK